MISTIALSTLFAELTGRLTGLNDQIMSQLNGLAGHSWLFDSLVGSSQENDLIKAGMIGCCFFAAWYSGKTVDEIRAHRKILMVTLVAAVCVTATTKLISHSVTMPRPAVRTQKIYHLTGDELVEMNRTRVRIPLDEASQKDHRDLLNGDVQKNNLESFPSDHAGFFLVISLGIFFASRRIGALALGWTVFVILAGKLITGGHAPVDIAAGAVVAISELSVLRFAARTRLGNLLDKVSLWTLKYSALSSALLFVVVFEITSTLFHVKQIVALLGAVRQRITG